MVAIDYKSRAVSLNAYKAAWIVALVFYFFEYLVRSAPAVMIPELTSAYNVDAVGLSAIVGSYYYTYSIASLVAGAALDRFGARAPIAIGAAFLALGCLLFAVAIPAVGETGRLLQGAGSSFAFTGAVYLAVHGFSGRVLATAVGVTQSLGMLGGTAGQLLVAPLIHGPLGWQGVWIVIAAACSLIAAGLFLVTPRSEPLGLAVTGGAKGLLEPFRIVFSNPQSYLCGLVAGLLFVPTTVGVMIWGVAFFQQDRGLAFGQAVVVVAMTPLGWAIGCPLVGWLADSLGRRKPALLIGAGLMLLSIGAVAMIEAPVVSYVAMLGLGIGSGAAMIPYSIIKEVNPDPVKGSATGVINFLTFSVTALIGPIFAHLVGAGLISASDRLAHFREASWFWALTVALAIALTFTLRETGRGSAPHGH